MLLRLRAALVLAALLPTWAGAVLDVNKSFTPANTTPGQNTVIEITLVNSRTQVLTNVAFNDPLPANNGAPLEVQAVSVVSNSCNGTVTLPNGGANIVLTGGTVPAAVVGGSNGLCRIRVNAVGLIPGVHINTIPAGGASGSFSGGIDTNPTAGSATLTVANYVAPTLIKAIPSGGNNFIHGGGTTQFVVRLTNPNAAALPITRVEDTLPTNLVINDGNVTNSCGGTFTDMTGNSLASGDLGIRLNGGSIPGNGSCEYVFTVRTASPNTADFTTARNTATATVPVPQVNGGTANATPSDFEDITLQTGGDINKSASPTNIPADGATRTTFTLEVKNWTLNNQQDVSFTDNLPSGLRAVTPVTFSNNCSALGGTAPSFSITGGGTAIAFNNIDIAAAPNTNGGETVCLITFQAISPVGTALGNQTNSIPSTVLTNGVVQYFGGDATVNITNSLLVNKSFSPTTVARGEVTTLTINLVNQTAADAAITGLTDNLDTLCTNPPSSNTCPAGSFTVAGAATTTCGGTVNATIGGTTITKNNGTIPANNSCSITVSVRANDSATLGGNHNNRIAQGAVATGIGNNVGNSDAPLTVADGVGGSKSFSPNSVSIGVPSTLTITLINRRGTPTIIESFTDNLSTMGAGLLVHTSPAPVTTCTGGAATLSATPGQTLITMTSGVIPANGSCTITVPVVSNGSASLGTKTNTVAINGLQTTLDDNDQAFSADLTLTAAITLAKSFNPTNVRRGAQTTVTLTLQNGSLTPASITSLTDDLTTMGANIALARSPVAADTNCGGTLSSNGSLTSINLVGGSIPAQGNCTITLPVQVAGNAALTTRTNSIPANGLVTSLGNNLNAVTASINVQTGLTIGKTFTPSSFNSNQAGVTRLSFTFTRPANAPALTNLTMTDDVAGTMGAGHMIADPVNLTNTCGGLLTATPGAGTWSISGGNLPRPVSGAQTTCTVALDVQLPTGVTDTRTNTVPIAAATTAEGITNSNQATASIARAKAPDLQVLNKEFIPVVINGGDDSQLVITFQNTRSGAVNLTGVSLLDNFFTSGDTGMVLSNNPDPQFTGTGCSGGVFTPFDDPGTPQTNDGFRFTGANIGANRTCTLTVNVTAFTDGNHDNLIPAASLVSDQGATNPSDALKTLTINRNVNLQKSFSPAVTEVGTTSILTLTVFNTNSVARTGCTAAGGSCTNPYAFQDSLPTNLVVAAGVSATTCPSALLRDGNGGTLDAGDTVIRVVGGNYAANTQCQITVPVTSNTSDSFTNTIPAGAFQTNEGSSNPDPTEDVVTFIARPTIAKAFSPTNIGVGGTSTMTFTLSNPNAAAILPAPGFTNARFTDDLMNMSVAVPTSAGGSCVGASSNSFAAGATALSFSGLTIPPNGSCTVTVPVTSTQTGTHPNTTSGVLTNQTQQAGNPSNTANLVVNALPTVTKAFSNPTIQAGASTTLTITLNNPNNIALNLANPALTDVFPTSPGQMSLSSATVTSTCLNTPTLTDNTGASLNVGDIGIRIANGSIPANSSCTITAQVTASVQGTYNNQTTVLDTVNGGSSLQAGQANVSVSSGFPLSGFVYRDGNTNGSRDNAEDWTAGVPVFINLVQGGVVVQSTTVNAGNGAYAFANVAPGNYEVILTNTATSTTPTAPTGWQSVSPNPGAHTLSMGAAPAVDYNFGLINGSRIAGVVFTDTGPTANDGIRQAGEAVGIGNVVMQLLDNNSAVIATTTTDAAGNYQFFIPTNVPNGTVLTVRQLQPSGYVSTGASINATAAPNNVATTVGGVAYTYVRATDQMSFAYNNGVLLYSALNFGEVLPPDLRVDNSSSEQAGTVVYYPHSFTAGTGGSVTFSTANAASPSIPGWQSVLFADINGNGQFDSGENTPLALAQIVVAGQTVNFLNRVFVPAGAPSGAQNISTVQAVFTYTNATPGITTTLTRQDVTLVGAPTAAGLELTKAVDKANAQPNEVITYVLTYRNTSSQPLAQVVISDATPTFTTYVGASAVCLAPLPAALTACVATTQPAAGSPGALKWTLSGTLSPNSTGQVRYQVRVNQ